MKTQEGNFFEDFQIGEIFRHAVPKTVTEADSCLYGAIFGGFYPLHCAKTFALTLGHAQTPIDDLLTFHLIFGKSVRDISLNAVANLGYAEGLFHKPVYAGDTLRSESEVIGKREVSSGKAGAVYVHTSGFNQNNECVLDYKRWVLVNKKDPASPAPAPSLPVFNENFADQAPDIKDFPDFYSAEAAGDRTAWEDYRIGQMIPHIDGVTVEESDHMTATRLFQNNARIHFNEMLMHEKTPPKRLIYGGHVISLARSLSFNGLANAYQILSINGGRHVAPLYAGDTVYARSEVIGKPSTASQKNGALRIRLQAFKNFQPTAETAAFTNDQPHPNLILDFDYTVAVPKEKFIK